MSQVWTPKNASLLPVICGPNHMNLLYLENELADGGLKAESQGGGIAIKGATLNSLSGDLAGQSKEVAA